MTTTTEKTPVDLVIAGLQKAATELEELQVQVALGKAEAKDIFETIKKELHTMLNEFKQKSKHAVMDDAVLPLVNAIEHLQIQLSLGIADTKQAFENQRKHIDSSIHVLETRLKHGVPGREAAKLHLEVEKFKAKLELLALKYQLKKISMQYDLKQKRAEFETKLAALRTTLNYKEEQLKEKWEHVREGIKDSFAHLKSLFLPFD